MYSKEDEEAIRLFFEAGTLSGLIKKTESPYGSALIVVTKPGSSKKRVCLDARLINQKLLRPVTYPLPLTDDIVKKLAHNTIFSTIDARNAFNQLKLSERSQKLVSFVTYLDGIRGTYTYTGMPFGISGGPAYYQQTIDNVTHKFSRPSSDLNSYIDDMTLGSRKDNNNTDIDNHIHDIDLLLGRLFAVGFKLRLAKCFFLQRSIEVCGFELSEGKYRPSQKHRELLRNLPPFSVLDNTKNALMRFLGKIGYHRRFGGSEYAALEKRFRELLHKYNNKQIKAEEADTKCKEISDSLIKKILETSLVIPTDNDVLVLNTDASIQSWGAVLIVPGKGIVSYHGGTFSKRVIDKYSIFGKEVLGVLNGLESNAEFIVKSPKTTCKVDNISAVLSSTGYKKHTKPQDIVNIMKIQQFISVCKGELILKHCSGTSNLMADFLSRIIYTTEDVPKEYMASMSEVNTTNSHQLKSITDDFDEIVTSRLKALKFKCEFSHFHTQKCTENGIEFIELVHTSRGHSTTVGKKRTNKPVFRSEDNFVIDKNESICLYREKENSPIYLPSYSVDNYIFQR